MPRHTEEGAATINRAIKQTFGLEVTVLYAAYEYNGEQEDGMAAQQIDVLENHSAGWQLPAAGRWVSAQQLPELTLTVPGHAQVIGQWFWEREQSHHAVQRRPWATRG